MTSRSPGAAGAFLATLVGPGATAPPTGEAPPVEEILSLAEREGVLPETVHGLGVAGMAPPRGHEILEAALARAEAQELLLGEIVDRLAARGIPFVVLKGRPLDRKTGLTVPRWHRDIDLLVGPRDLAGAGEVLRSLGYHPRPGPRPPRSFHEPWALHARDRVGPLELHWDVTPPGHAVRFPVERWLHEPGRVELGWGDVPVPPAADEAGYLAWHAFTRGIPRLRDLLSLAAAWTSLSPGLRERAVEAAAVAGVRRFLAEGLHLAAATWPGADLAGRPAPARSGLRGRCLGAWCHPGVMLGRPGPAWQQNVLVHWALLPPGRPGCGLFSLLARSIEDTGAPPRRWFTLARGGVSVLVSLLAASLRPERPESLVSRRSSGQDG